MELNQRTIQKGEFLKTLNHQFQLDADLNVPDLNDDVHQVIQADAQLHINECVQVEESLKVKGSVDYQILYVTENEEQKISVLEGKLQVEESIYIENGEKTQFDVRCNQIDFVYSMIHSRKLNLKAMVELSVDGLCTIEGVLTTGVDTNKELIQKITNKSVVEMTNNIKDTYRIKEEVKLSGTKDNIASILMSKVGCHKIDSRVGQDEINFRGEFQFFCMYLTDEWKEEWVAQTVPFEGRIDCYGITEGTYHYMKTNMEDLVVDISMDEDGELRIFGVENTLKIDVFCYEEVELELLEDVYSLQEKCILDKEMLMVESLVLQNQSKCKLVESLALPELKDELLQICCSSGVAQIENAEIIENGIEVEGILHMSFLYVKSDDALPYGSWQGMIPFKHVIECVVHEEMVFNLNGNLEQITVSMAGNEEVEVKAIIGINSYVRKPELMEVIQGVELEGYTKEELKNEVAIVGYIYKKDEDLWEVAKKYHTTVDRILSVNDLSIKDVKTGQKLLIFRENLSIL